MIRHKIYMAQTVWLSFFKSPCIYLVSGSTNAVEVDYGRNYYFMWVLLFLPLSNVSVGNCHSASLNQICHQSSVILIWLLISTLNVTVNILLYSCQCLVCLSVYRCLLHVIKCAAMTHNKRPIWPLSNIRLMIWYKNTSLFIVHNRFG